MHAAHPTVCSLETGKCTKDLEKTASRYCPPVLNRVTFAIIVASKIAKVHICLEIISGMQQNVAGLVLQVANAAFKYSVLMIAIHRSCVESLTASYACFLETGISKSVIIASETSYMRVVFCCSALEPNFCFDDRI